MRPEGLSRCVQLKPLRWGISWSSRWGRCDHRVLMKGKQGGQSEGGGMIVGAEVCAMHSENGRWPPAKECGQPPEAARGQGRGPPPQACRRGHFRQHSTPPACRRDQFHQHLPLRTSWLQPLDIQNSGRVNLCLSWWWFVKATTGNEYRGIHLWLVQFKIVQGRGLGGEGRFGVHQLRQPLLQDERELGGLLETLKLGTRGQEVGGDSSVGGCKWWASVEPLQEL